MVILKETHSSSYLMLLSYKIVMEASRTPLEMKAPVRAMQIKKIRRHNLGNYTKCPVPSSVRFNELVFDS